MSREALRLKLEVNHVSYTAVPLPKAAHLLALSQYETTLGILRNETEQRSTVNPAYSPSNDHPYHTLCAGRSHIAWLIPSLSSVAPFQDLQAKFPKQAPKEELTKEEPPSPEITALEPSQIAKISGDGMVRLAVVAAETGMKPLGKAAGTRKSLTLPMGTGMPPLAAEGATNGTPPPPPPPFPMPMCTGMPPLHHQSKPSNKRWAKASGKSKNQRRCRLWPLKVVGQWTKGRGRERALKLIPWRKLRRKLKAKPRKWGWGKGRGEAAPKKDASVGTTAVYLPVEMPGDAAEVPAMMIMAMAVTEMVNNCIAMTGGGLAEAAPTSPARGGEGEMNNGAVMSEGAPEADTQATYAPDVVNEAPKENGAGAMLLTTLRRSR
ncbi:hypothetical protein BJ875DRAFT_521685 [Amylocarpus encephaloides]|uniref:Uncharacterized protein n=1 Tax=Amylocarpus encephaloides TaxID=45428 RepID=A0A9P7YA01_9HELO|nr:hypothetical protein BJ875DRAFT_521685 [Amylocarpus encephaloides]